MMMMIELTRPRTLRDTRTHQLTRRPYCKLRRIPTSFQTSSHQTRAPAPTTSPPMQVIIVVVKARTEGRNTSFTRSSKHRANVKQTSSMMELRPWLKFRPSCYIGYNPPALLISMLITIARPASWMPRVHDQAVVEQTSSNYHVYFEYICSMSVRCLLDRVNGV